MKRTVAGITISPSDVCSWMDCQWAVIRHLDGILGLTDPVGTDADAMLERTARLGAQHEARYRAQLRREHPGSMIEFTRDNPGSRAATMDAFESGARVIYQPVFSSSGFEGRPDFLVLDDDDRYRVLDTKLALSAKVSALIQVAAYVDWLEQAGIPVSPWAVLVLGDGTESAHDTRRIAPVYRSQRAALRDAITLRQTASAPVEWGDEQFAACGRCSLCASAAEEHRDLVLVARLRVSQRAAFRAAGIPTIDALAAAGPEQLDRVRGIGRDTVQNLHRQARLQIASENAAGGGVGGSPGAGEAAGGSPVAVPPVFEVIDPEHFRLLPQPDPGDIFFDFEGDPLYQERGQWGLDYLFGYVDTQERFTSYWAHDLDEERQALIDFLADVERRLQANPNLHIYHYAPYEKTHLLSLAGRHEYGEDMVDDLLRRGVLVDLYPVVRQALRVGSRSYSIKKLEPLYMGADLRDEDGVTDAAASIDAYAEAMLVRSAGDTARAGKMLAEIADYNEYDCRSTLRLRDWLLDLARDAGVPPQLPEQATEAAAAQEAARESANEENQALLAGFDSALAGTDPLNRTAEETALALGRASLLYYEREAKTFWQEHFSRLTAPIDDWADARDVFTAAHAEVVEDWHPVKKSQARTLRLTGQFGPGSKLSPGTAMYAIFDPSASTALWSPVPGGRAACKATVLDIGHAVADTQLLVEVKVGPKKEPFEDLPVALTPTEGPSAQAKLAAIQQRWAPKILGMPTADIRDPAFDLLVRRPPRGAIAPAGADGAAEAILTTLRSLDNSYLAVQGPPGTGKTFTGSHVIAALIAAGWTVAVTGQSNAVAENFLAAVAKRGVPAEKLLKKTSDPDLQGTNHCGWTGFADWKKLWAHVDEQPGGCLVGGTSWMAGQDRDFDLVVIDEAGQYALPDMIAISTLAPRLLLLGDPQQLPNVTQAAHPEPVDRSALGWLSDGHDVLPPEFGYFLPRSYRMHSEVTHPVSRLSYESRLDSCAPARTVEGVAPGLHVIDVEHFGSTTLSEEEAAAVVAIVRNAVGRRFAEVTDTGVAERLLEPADIIVVAPFNAQVNTIREELDAAGLRATPVGTVDKFQGQEAAIAIMSMTTSAASEVPRGLDFLFSRNRLNVAISRAQCAAFLVQSPQLELAVPSSVKTLDLVSGYIGLLESASSRSALLPDDDALALR
ncbi:TM0106 family RecB-like putative nuclease [Brevibacterium daeguense]|uniref:TM0106 family RecB-like putative nuclease n=1 Tax=Brevibacterium daeguense TaxID=909936 RepID=A0ABP8EJS8_9MICO|nr:TM0106 family RecB-like putative nuclease [Brevibacterium daeguense]